MTNGLSWHIVEPPPWNGFSLGAFWKELKALLECYETFLNGLGLNFSQYAYANYELIHRRKVKNDNFASTFLTFRYYLPASRKFVTAVLKGALCVVAYFGVFPLAYLPVLLLVERLNDGLPSWLEKEDFLIITPLAFAKSLNGITLDENFPLFPRHPFSTH